MTTTTIPPSCSSYLHIVSAYAGNRVHRLLKAETVRFLPEIPTDALPLDMFAWGGEVLGVAARVGFEVPLDADLAGVFFLVAPDVFHTYCWVVVLDDASSIPRTVEISSSSCRA